LLPSNPSLLPCNVKGLPLMLMTSMPEDDGIETDCPAKVPCAPYAIVVVLPPELSTREFPRTATVKTCPDSVKVAVGGSLLPWWFADPAGDVKETAAPLITTASTAEGTPMACPANVAVVPAASVDLAPFPWMMTAPLLDIAVKVWPS
jgi:hypothetical protein